MKSGTLVPLLSLAVVGPVRGGRKIASPNTRPQELAGITRVTANREIVFRPPLWGRGVTAASLAFTQVGVGSNPTGLTDRWRVAQR